MVMHWTDEKDVLMFCEVIEEGAFDHKSKSREGRTSWQNVTTTLNAIDGFLLTYRAVTDRATNLLKRFSAKNISEKSNCQEKEE